MHWFSPPPSLHLKKAAFCDGLTFNSSSEANSNSNITFVWQKALTTLECLLFFLRKELTPMTYYNFAAGPAMLPVEVIAQIKEDLPVYKNSGMSVMEISHRSKLYQDLYEETKADMLDLMKLDPAEYDVLFLTGGATQQFTTIPLNIARKYRRIALVDSGHWAQRAGEDAQKLPNLEVDTVASAKDNNYTAVPEIPTVFAKDYDYVHITTNNTIMGTAYRDDQVPDLDLPLVADMSSNFLGQVYDFNKFDLIYAGAQKNLAPAGLTVLIIKKDLLVKHDDLPGYFDFATEAAKKSALNTPPVFQVYVAGLALKWLKKQGGVAGIAKVNQEKANLLYNTLAETKNFESTVDENSRSIMNVPFVTGNPDLDAEFVKEAEAHHLLNLKGHRLVGGMRASIYNAMPLEGVQALCDFIKDFDAKH